MKIERTEIRDVLVLCPQLFGDERGFFLESYNQRDFEVAGISDRFVQDNHSRSRRGVLRGLHYQLTQTQGKLVRVVQGIIWDVAVDIRPGSPTFAKWVGRELSAQNREMLWVPKGFAHGFVVLSEFAEVLYKASDYYHPESERSILWNDPTLAIDWPIETPPVLSAKDLAGKRIEEAEIFDERCGFYSPEH